MEENKPSSKTPNVVIYGEDKCLAEHAVPILATILPSDRYVLYTLDSKAVATEPWENKSLALVVVGDCNSKDNSKKALEKIIEVINGQDMNVLLWSIEQNLLSTIDSSKYVTINTVDDLSVKGKRPVVKYESDVTSTDVQVVRSIFEFCFGMDVTKTGSIALKRTPAYLVTSGVDGTHKFVNRLRQVLARDKRTLPTLTGQPKINLVTILRTETIPDATETILPIITDSEDDCTSFGWERYFSLLSTASLGRTLIHAEVMGSAFDPMLAVNDILVDGLTVLADVQLSGRGRGGNKWISNRGCLMVAFQFSVGQGTPLGANMPYCNILVGLAAAEAVRRMTGRDLVRLKWPNDLYIEGSKVGGVMIFAQPNFSVETVLYQVNIITFSSFFHVIILLIHDRLAWV